MPRPGITREQVFEAAEHLTQADHNPTVLAIRAHLGSGSPNTIGPHLADWKAQHDTAQAEAVPPLPEPIETAMQQVWGLAVRQAQDQLQGERQALNVVRKEIGQERAELSAEIEHLDAAVEQAQSEVRKAVEALNVEREAHNQTKEKLQGEVADLRNEATAARERVANLEGQVTALKEQFEALTVASPDREPAPAKTGESKAGGTGDNPK
ncbi:MAG: Tn4651 auxiliary cointegrate resolution protein T [Olavius algarvensis Gamma 1 endosymbiont]|nr:MAG: Tn4651 auxiliary cointegrate resolution protein T [Olavius algarvensis Gamma 1 endosymbiont]